MSQSEYATQGRNVRCTVCRHIQWVPVDQTFLSYERCDAQLTRR